MSESKYDRGQYDSVFKAVSKAIASWPPRRYVLPDIPKLLALPRGQAVMTVRSLRKLHTAEAAKQFRLASEERRTSNPPLALHLAELAVYAARPAVAHGWVLCGGLIERDVLAECLATLGNAQRIVGNFKDARQHLKEAAQVARLGSWDPLVEAKVERLTAVLLLDTGHPDEALDLFLRCEATYKKLGEEVRANRVRHYVAQVHLRAGRPDAALRCAHDCYKKSSVDGDPVLKQNLLSLVAQAQIDRGEPEEAREIAKVIQERCSRPEFRAAKARGEWIEARALLALGRWKEGVEGLDLAREEMPPSPTSSSP